ncbi:hypothetical protein Q428_01100 [Fervidicella metallireducens AeB]|uniref:Uncharacterized protein n=1 Tax=Fervidicella metallireducens AeB TaxID=1403537 RepID=A0A017RY65_9CLOT|nr:hypothetical protein [Fervidicella metallireducens]EYE89718.1 hypothetical protein Q428_01100 [Fervidicella metallireducens AeB]
MDFEKFDNNFEFDSDFEDCHDDFRDESCHHTEQCCPQPECDDIICKTELVPFCCCITVPEEYDIVSVCKKYYKKFEKHDCYEEYEDFDKCDRKHCPKCKPLILSAISKHCVKVVCEPTIVKDVPIKTPLGKLCCDVPVKKLRLCGPILIQNSLLTRKCDEYKFFSCCAKTFIDKVICIKCPNYKHFNIAKVHVCVDLDSLELTPLPNSCCECKDRRYKITGCVKVCVEICPC